MASDKETLADIVETLRRFATKEEIQAYEIPSFTQLANRIEAAHLREVAAGNAYAYMIRTDNSAVVAELQRRLKVAEDALELCKGGMCGECSRQHPDGVCVSPNGCYEMATIRNALAAIRKEGDAK